MPHQAKPRIGLRFCLYLKTIDYKFNSQSLLYQLSIDMYPIATNANFQFQVEYVLVWQYRWDMVVAGRGSCFTEKGTVEMDASIMDGRNLATGGVTCVEDVANPVSVARAVMEKVRQIKLSSYLRKFSNKIQNIPWELMCVDRHAFTTGVIFIVGLHIIIACLQMRMVLSVVMQAATSSECEIHPVNMVNFFNYSKPSHNKSGMCLNIEAEYHTWQTLGYSESNCHKRHNDVDKANHLII